MSEQIRVALAKQVASGSKKKLFRLPIPYQTLLEFPPKNVEISFYPIESINLSMKFIRPIYWFANKLGIDLRTLYYRLKKKQYQDEYDLLHAGSFIPESKNYVLDLEAISNLVTDVNDMNQRKSTSNHLSSECCKHILTWSEVTRSQLLNLFPDLENKSTTVYPALPVHARNKISNKNLSFLFVGTEFINKGGWETLEAVSRLPSDIDITLKVISKVPNNIKKSYMNDKRIQFCNTVSRNELFEIYYPNADLLIFPARFEAFGLITLEAFSFGIPVLGSDSPVQKELVQDEQFIVTLEENILDKRGFFDTKKQRSKDAQETYYETEVAQIYDAILEFITNPGILESQSKKVHKQVASGIFSLVKRNQKLKKIYSEAASK